jgi:hypothetical protein
VSANETQVGGTHYKVGDKPEHWDLAIMYKWDPFQYQITKYVMRWKTKHITPEERLKDLKKAQHFIQKYIENFEAYDKGNGAWEHQQLPSGWTMEGFFGDMDRVYTCKKCTKVFRATSLGHAMEQHDASGTCAGPK